MDPECSWSGESPVEVEEEVSEDPPSLPGPEPPLEEGLAAVEARGCCPSTTWGVVWKRMKKCDKLLS